MKNKFTDAFIKRTFRMIESPAYRVLAGYSTGTNTRS